MIRQIGSLNSSLSEPISDPTSSPLPSFTNNSPRMDSDDDSTNTVFHTISQLNNSDIDTPDELQNSEPSPSLFSQPLPSAPHHNPRLNFPSSFLFYRRSPNPLPNDQRSTRPSSPVNEELEYELDIFVTSQQQLPNTDTLTIHHLSQPISSSKSSNSASTVEETRAHRVFKRKLPNS